MSENQVTRPELEAIESKLAERIGGLESLLMEVKAMLKESLDKSSGHAIEIALIKQEMTAERKWKYIWGGSVVAGVVEFVLRKYH